MTNKPIGWLAGTTRDPEYPSLRAMLEMHAGWQERTGKYWNRQTFEQNHAWTGRPIGWAANVFRLLEHQVETSLFLICAKKPSLLCLRNRLQQTKILQRGLNIAYVGIRPDVLQTLPGYRQDDHPAMQTPAELIPDY